MFQLVISHNSHLVVMSSSSKSAESQKIVSRTWSDLSNQKDVEKLERQYRLNLSPIITCTCHICSRHEYRFESYKTFMKRVLPEFVSFKYLLYYYFCKSEVDESKVLSQGID